MLNRRIEPSHYPCQRNSFALIGNNQQITSAFNFGLIQQGEFFPGLGPPHPNTAFEFIEIETVHRLTQLHHHKVGNIDYRAYRT